MANELPKYPRTLHVGDSGGRLSKHHSPMDALMNKNLVIEEKIDGTHCGFFFDDEASLNIFSRQTIIHYKTTVLPSNIDPSLSILLDYANKHLDDLWDVLENRYILYGEWAYLTHTIYYDKLPQYFLEDDIYDCFCKQFLSTNQRLKITPKLPSVFSSSVPILFQGKTE